MVTGPNLPYRFEQPIITPRLVLRTMTEADTDAIYAYQSREDVCRYLLFKPRSREQVAEKVSTRARAAELAADGDYLQLALVLRESEAGAGRLIGDAFFAIVSTEHSRGEIGWTMHPDHSGRGYATEAARAVLDLAFGTLGLHRVTAELDVRNDASIRMCRRLGMREEAHLVQDMMFKGDWADTGVYAILDQEWQRARSAGRSTATAPATR